VFYEAIAVGDHSVLCHFEDAVSRQEFIQEIEPYILVINFLNELLPTNSVLKMTKNTMVSYSNCLNNVEDITLKEGIFAQMSPINRNIARVL
jgi:hypothetical protein